MGEEGLGYIRGYCIAEAVGSPAGDGSDVEIFLTTWVCGSKDIAASSTITDGSLPRVYDAVNSQGRPDFRHNAHGHLPVHLTFFLYGMLVCSIKHVTCTLVIFKLTSYIGHKPY